MRIASIIAGILIFVAVCVLASFFYFKARALDSKCAQIQQDMFRKCDEGTIQILAEKEKLSKENEKLQEYLENNFKEGKKELAIQLQEAQKTIDNQTTKLKLFNKKLEELQEISIEKQKYSAQKISQLKNRIKAIDKSFKKQKAVFHYNLAVAYTKAGFYIEAISAYEKSLNIDQNNADANYNLGLLYKNLGKELDKARMYLLRYLELKPNADDKGEVKAWIEKLK